METDVARSKYLRRTYVQGSNTAAEVRGNKPLTAKQ